jgi:hypothetical protein
VTVYVDDLKVWSHAKHRCFKQGSAHLTADTLDELHAFAARLGLKRAWFQDHIVAPHYDLSPAKHAASLTLGATHMSAIAQARMRRQRRVEARLPESAFHPDNVRRSAKAIPGDGK